MNSLKDKQENHGWKFEVTQNPESLRLENTFWISKKGIENARKFRDIIEFDATYKTNRFGLPLVLFSGVDSNGVTLLFAGALIVKENQAAYEWVLKLFLKYVCVSPKVVITDSAPEIRAAIEAVLPESKYLVSLAFVKEFDESLATSSRRRLC